MAQINISPEVSSALAENRPVVALESTIISHGLPRPRNKEAAYEFESILRERGVTPATIAVVDGVPTVGLDESGLNAIADQEIAKASVRDLPILAAKGLSGATTVAATAHIAAMAGVRVFATGGLGGVHRGASETFDESADLSTLALAPVAVVCAGVKSVLESMVTERTELDAKTRVANEDALRAEWGGEFRKNTNLIHGLLDGFWHQEVSGVLAPRIGF